MRGKILVIAMALLLVSGVAYAAEKTLTFAWNQDGVVTGWRLYQTTDPSTPWPWQEVGTVPYESSQSEYTGNFTITVPDNAETSLWFKMTAYNADGDESPPSGEAIPAPIVLDFLAPDPPVVSASYEASNRTVTVSWNDPAVPDGETYRVYMADVAGGPYTDLGGGVSPFTYVVPEGVTGNLYFVVVAFDDDGNSSGNSNEVTIDVTLPIPSAPYSLTVTVETN